VYYVGAVFFDAAGTLIRAEPPVAEVYAQALADAGIHADMDDVGREFEAAWRRIRAEQPPGRPAYGSTEPAAMVWWRRVVRESFEPFGLPDDFEGTFLALWEHFASGQAWRVYDDVLPTFEVLERRGKGIGLLSNWDARLFALLDDLGLRKHMRWVIISAEVGVEKPHPGIFQRALADCGLPAEKVVHVGDSYAEDVLGAQSVGIKAVWLRRSPHGGPAPQGVAAITSLAELPPLLA
jgi:putative hydrolase of the HAD superfamily